jgi:riboflavin kinase/FMN adenylyltransferase
LHLFDFNGDLYGDRIRVDFIERIRDIARFNSADALVHAMEADCQRARHVLRVASHEPGR